MLRPVRAANAAQVTPRRGNGPHPKIRQGSRMRLMMFDTHSRRMAMAASPAPRKIALLRNRRRTAKLPPRQILAYPLPVETISGVAPIRRNKFGANKKQGMPMATEMIRPRVIACTPATAAPSGSFSPMRRATIAVVDKLSPMPTAKTRLNMDSVRPTVATAFAPRRPTQKTSTTANKDSSTISSTMGTARRKMAQLRLAVVKSWCEPRMASTSDVQRVCGFSAIWVVASIDVRESDDHRCAAGNCWASPGRTAGGGCPHKKQINIKQATSARCRLFSRHLRHPRGYCQILYHASEDDGSDGSHENAATIGAGIVGSFADRLPIVSVKVVGESNVGHNRRLAVIGYAFVVVRSCGATGEKNSVIAVGAAAGEGKAS